MSANSTTLKWNQEEANRCKELKVFMTNIYGKNTHISFKRHSFYWNKNKNFVFIDYILENDEPVYIRVADDIEKIKKFLKEIGKKVELLDEWALAENNTGYKYFCPRNNDFMTLETLDYSKSRHFKELMLEISNKKFLNATEIQTIDDILYLGTNLNQAKRVSIVGKNLPVTLLNKRAVRPNKLRTKIKDALSNNLLIDVSDYGKKDKDYKLVTEETAENSNLIFSKKIGIASNNKRNFEMAYKDSYESDQRMSEDFTSDYEHVLSLFDKKILDENESI